MSRYLLLTDDRGNNWIMEPFGIELLPVAYCHNRLMAERICQLLERHGVEDVAIPEGLF